MEENFPINDQDTAWAFDYSFTYGLVLLVKT